MLMLGMVEDFVHLFYFFLFWLVCIGYVGMVDGMDGVGDGCGMSM